MDGEIRKIGAALKEFLSVDSDNQEPLTNFLLKWCPLLSGSRSDDLFLCRGCRYKIEKICNLEEVEVFKKEQEFLKKLVKEYKKEPVKEELERSFIKKWHSLPVGFKSDPLNPIGGTCSTPLCLVYLDFKASIPTRYFTIDAGEETPRTIRTWVSKRLTEHRKKLVKRGTIVDQQQEDRKRNSSRRHILAHLMLKEFSDFGCLKDRIGKGSKQVRIAGLLDYKSQVIFNTSSSVIEAAKRGAEKFGRLSDEEKKKYRHEAKEMLAGKG